MGGISRIRGVVEVVKSISDIDVKFNLVGEFTELEYENKIKNERGWEKVNYKVVLNRQEVLKIMSQSKIGIVTFLPVPNHINSQPNKMFEYMSAGLPIITSNFTLWKEIVEGNYCGICVDPKNPKDIAKAIQYLLNNPNEAKIMRENGRNAIVSKYNWEIEEKKLIEIYQKI